ncbi:MAG: thiamine pyrophosphate-dependent enzyme [Myxococcota bacterium]
MGDDPIAALEALLDDILQGKASSGRPARASGPSFRGSHPNLGDADLGDANFGDADLGDANFGDADLGEPALGRSLFDAYSESRHLDYAARRLRKERESFYTIASAGHEPNALVAAALRDDDPAFLHYRSGAFYCYRARRSGLADPVSDILLGIVASRDEPIAGGRHKVFGSRPLHIPPQTSTIGSHLPKALGTALAIERAKKLRRPTPWPEDAVVLASFGDASANHSTAVGAIHAARACVHQGFAVPLLLVCEDNGWGISVPTSPTWIREAYGSLPGLGYCAADGADPSGALGAIRRAVARVRKHRRPILLHLRVERLLGHAGSDIEAAYRSADSIRNAQHRDPLVALARALLRDGADPRELRARYRTIGGRVRRAARAATGREKLRDVDDVVWPLAPRTDAVNVEARQPAPSAARTRMFNGGPLPEERPPGTLAEGINRALSDLLAKYPEMLVFGEDVAAKGGVYGVTRGLRRRAGPARVFDSILDEQSILGFAIGAAHAGFLPVPEIQYLAYLHNAADQLRGEAATLQFFSQDQFRNPMVLRIAGFAYQKGFGGHFHNDHSIAALRDIPGIVLAVPSRGDDAAGMLHTCLAAAKTDGTVSVIIEPIALYHTRDLHRSGDGAWTFPYPDAPVPLAQARRYGDGDALTIVSFGNGVPMSLRVAARLVEDGIGARVVDLRWVAPLPMADVLAEAHATGRVLIADESRRTGGVGEGLIAELLAAGFAGPIDRVSSLDSLVPLGPAAEHVLLSENAIEQACRTLLSKKRA